MTLTPAFIASWIEWISCFSPRMKISPLSAWYIPPRIFISVDFPAPFSPTIAWTSPSSIERLTSDSALTPGNDLLILRISMIANCFRTSLFCLAAIPAICSTCFCFYCNVHQFISK